MLQIAVEAALRQQDWCPRGPHLSVDRRCIVPIGACIILLHCDSKELGVELQQISRPAEACDQKWQTCDRTHHEASGRVIALYREGLEKVQAAELKRLYNRLPQLNEHSRLEVRQFADRLVATMLHPPLESLRDESRNGSPHVLLEALQRLFRLND